MDCLLLNGKNVCRIKIDARAGRVRLDPNSSVSFPKTISFWCSKRPLPPYGYAVKLRGIGVVPINIKTVGAPLPSQDYYHVSADVGRLTDTYHEPTNRIISPSHRIPGRATGYLIFILRW